ncbi:hypothetical protein [Thermococcus peptonophilus]|uniref:hypothetical protein n=1 Tax=Thermococcus peptonophilus TaxID=53952 RepID=UPI000A919B72
MLLSEVARRDNDKATVLKEIQLKKLRKLRERLKSFIDKFDYLSKEEPTKEETSSLPLTIEALKGLETGITLGGRGNSKNVKRGAFEVEIILSPEEFEQVKKNRREIEKRFQDLEGLERTLKALKFEYLIEHRNNLREKLEEMEGGRYRELVELEEKAKRDKEFLMKVREELSRENRSLRRELEESKNEGGR